MNTVQWLILSCIFLMQAASKLIPSTVYASPQPQCNQVNLRILENISLLVPSSTACAAVCAGHEECLSFHIEKLGESYYCILQARNEVTAENEASIETNQRNRHFQNYFMVGNVYGESNCMSSVESTTIIEETTTIIEETTTMIEETTPIIEETTTMIETTPTIEETTTIIEETTTIIEETTTIIEKTTTIIEETTTIIEETTTIFSSEDCLKPSVEIPLNALGFSSAKFWIFNAKNRTVCKIAKHEDFITYIQSNFKTCPAPVLMLDVDFPNFPTNENVKSVFEPQDNYLGIITDADNTLLYKTSDTNVTSITVVQDIPAEVQQSFTAATMDTSVVFMSSSNTNICYPEKLLTQWVDKNAKADLKPINWIDISSADKTNCQNQIVKWTQLFSQMMNFTSTSETLLAINGEPNVHWPTFSSTF